MKKLVTIILMMTYMACAIGFTFSFHYCGGHYKYVCFTADTEEDCCGENEHKTNCCDDKVVSAKVKDHTAFAKMLLAKVFFVHDLQPSPQYSYKVAYHTGYRYYWASNSSPPIVTDVPIYLLNRVLRI